VSIPFKVNDAVKFDDPNSMFVWYGTVVKVNAKSLVILSSTGQVQTVPKSRVNFD
jgi:small-conductance mechanosensitive channel